MRQVANDAMLGGGAGGGAPIIHVFEASSLRESQLLCLELEQKSVC